MRVRNAVLVVDDDAEYRELVEVVLADLDLEVLEAPDCAAGVAILRRERDRIAVVLLDYFMPGMTPIQCGRAIAQLAGDDVRVVVVTASVDAAERAAELGFQHWLRKPFDLDDFRRAVLDGAADPSPPP